MDLEKPVWISGWLFYAVQLAQRSSCKSFNFPVENDKECAALPGFLLLTL